MFTILSYYLLLIDGQSVHNLPVIIHILKSSRLPQLLFSHILLKLVFMVPEVPPLLVALGCTSLCADTENRLFSFVQEILQATHPFKTLLVLLVV